MKIISLYAGPGSGKSTTAAALFALMKQDGHSVELVTEAAKDLTWEDHSSLLQNSVWVLAEQWRRIDRLAGQVDYVITDSPILLSLAYVSGIYAEQWFTDMVRELDAVHKTARVYVNRVKPYVQTGRNQTKSEAKGLDIRIRSLLLSVVPKEQILYVDGDKFAPLGIYRGLIEKGFITT